MNIVSRASVMAITEKGVKIQGRTPGLIPCDHVVLEDVPVPKRSLLEGLRGKVKNLVVIGDCVEPRDLYHAIHEGFRAAYMIT